MQREPHELAGPPSLHAAMLKGGTEISTYAERCTLKVERRTVPGETVEAVTAELQAIVDRLAGQDSTFKATVKVDLSRKPFEVRSDVALVQVVDEALGNHLGHRPEHISQSFWTDAALTSDAGMETVLLGPKGGGLHSAEEWVEIQSLVDLAHVLAQSAIKYCK